MQSIDTQKELEIMPAWAFPILSQKPQKVESGIPTQEDLIGPPSFIPDNFPVRLAFDIEYAMLRNELFVGQILLP